MDTHLTERLDNISGKDLKSIISKISKIDEFKGFWKVGPVSDRQALGRLKRSIVVTSTGASTRIEGSHLSDKDVEKLLKGLRVNKKLTDRDSQEVAGYAEVLQTVFDSYRDIPFTEGVILQFHDQLLQYSEKDQKRKGKYKSAPNKVVAFDKAGGETVLFNPTEPHLTPSEMRELIEWTKSQLQNRETHPLFVIANFIVEFLAIHPFHDGNGRLSRILTNLLLLHAGYTYMPYASLEKIIEDHKIEYYIALRTVQKDGKSPKAEIARWIHFFLDVMVRQIEVLQGFLRSAPKEALLSPNQQKTLTLLDKHDEISTKLIAARLKIPTVSAKQILNRLLELKLVKRVGVGRTTRYIKP
ncbi:MAG: Fic family protein [Bdellovibrionota bacterium]